MSIGHLLGQDLDVCLQHGEIDLLWHIGEVIALLCKKAVVIEIPYYNNNTRVLTPQTTKGTSAINHSQILTELSWLSQITI